VPASPPSSSPTEAAPKQALLTQALITIARKGLRPHCSDPGTFADCSGAAEPIRLELDPHHIRNAITIGVKANELLVLVNANGR
jgi:hypothetical protein